jgi:GAF domain-containing protein
MGADFPGAAGRTEREGAIAETFVRLAGALVEDYDLLELFDLLMTSCVNLLDVRAAGLLLDDQRGNLQVVASSAEETRLLEVFQLQNNEGPCLECVRTAETVWSNDLAAEHERWPRFAARAADAGYNAVVAVPMRLREEVLGALNLFHDDGRHIEAGQRRLAQAFADVATIGILQGRSVTRSTALADQLQSALNSRVVIEQAKGIIAERHQVSMPLAFASLRRYARDHNRRLTDVAKAVVDGEVSPDPRRR